MKTVITFGTFDVFHVGHLRILQRARALGDRLVVGVSTDKLSYEKKGRFPICSEKERLEIVSAIKYVGAVFLEESLDRKLEYIRIHQAEILVMGDDWSGVFDTVSDKCRVVYVDRTPSISTTEIIERIKL